MTFTPFVVIATKGRNADCLRLVDCLEKQSLQPAFTLFVGTEQADIQGLNDLPWMKSGKGKAIISDKIGSSHQRNFGMETLEKEGWFAKYGDNFFCAFFDDDFRLVEDWLEKAAQKFLDQTIVGLTGRVLADGACTGVSGHQFEEGQEKGVISEKTAQDFLSGKRPPIPHWTGGDQEKEVDSVYGCNMAFAGKVIRSVRFDENVPLYGWQEDRDYTSLAKRFGRIIYNPSCRGVHMATKSGGRTSGVKFGYSQIINLAYFVKKGTIGWRYACKLGGRNVLSNLLHSTTNHPTTDYKGRLKGNALAARDLLKGQINPMRILEL